MREAIKLLEEAAEAQGVKLYEDDGAISGRTFMELGVPMVVACTGCEMTMAVTNSLVDDDGYIWCRSCAHDDESPSEED